MYLATTGGWRHCLQSTSLYQNRGTEEYRDAETFFQKNLCDTVATEFTQCAQYFV